MLDRIIRHLRVNVVAYIALAVALGGGGGYALAASSGKTITVCADKRTGVLHLHNRGRCKRSQTRLSWPAQQAPNAIRAWGVISPAGDLIRGVGLSGQTISTGNYQVTVSPTRCQPSTIVPTVTIEGAVVNGAFPVASAYVKGSTNQIIVTTGFLGGAAFTPANEAFNVQVACS
jgi:hypothetical protein